MHARNQKHGNSRPRRAAASVLVATALMLAACGDVNITGPDIAPGGWAATSRAADVSGTWDVTITVIEGTMLPPGSRITGVLTLTQTAPGAGQLFPEVKGSLTMDPGLGGKVSGRLMSSGLFLSLQHESPCEGEFRTAAGVSEDGQRLSGEVSGSDCNGSIDEADFVARRR